MSPRRARSERTITISASAKPAIVSPSPTARSGGASRSTTSTRSRSAAITRPTPSFPTNSPGSGGRAPVGRTTSEPVVIAARGFEPFASRFWEEFSSGTERVRHQGRRGRGLLTTAPAGYRRAGRSWQASAGEDRDRQEPRSCPQGPSPPQGWQASSTPSPGNALVNIITWDGLPTAANSRFMRNRRNASAPWLVGSTSITSCCLRSRLRDGAGIRERIGNLRIAATCSPERIRVSNASRRNASPMPSTRPRAIPSSAYFLA